MIKLVLREVLKFKFVCLSSPSVLSVFFPFFSILVTLSFTNVRLQQFHCNTQTPDRIFLIRETSICNYVMLIHTPRLCAEPIFLERRRGTGPDDSPAGGGGNQQIEQVRCRPIVDRLGLEAITPESEAKDKDNVDGTAGGEENQDEDVIMVVQTDAKQDDLKVVFDQQTGEVVQVQDMKGNIVFDEIKVEDLVGRVGDDRAPDTEDEDLETLKGLHDLAKIVRLLSFLNFLTIPSHFILTLNTES